MVITNHCFKSKKINLNPHICGDIFQNFPRKFVDIVQRSSTAAKFQIVKDTVARKLPKTAQKLQKSNTKIYWNVTVNESTNVEPMILGLLLTSNELEISSLQFIHFWTQQSTMSTSFYFWKPNGLNLKMLR